MTPGLKIIGGSEGARLAELWGSRPIEPLEREKGVWFLYRSKAIGWLEPTKYKNAFCIHYTVNPEFRKTFWPVKKCLADAAEHAADLADRLKGVLVVVPTSDDMLEYLPRLGFEFDPESRLWCYLFGEEDPDGEE
ncbi:MAG: hypothetical protein ACR2QM_12605 [Longimicrobiales bacterium]